MLLNIFAEPVTKVLRRKRRTLKRLSTILKMNSAIQHCTTQSLSDQAIQFRSAYGMTNGMKNRTMQQDLIAEEYLEFRQSMRE